MSPNAVSTQCKSALPRTQQGELTVVPQITIATIAVIFVMITYGKVSLRLGKTWGIFFQLCGLPVNICATTKLFIICSKQQQKLYIAFVLLRTSGI